MNAQPSQRHNTGFTLVEVVISSSLMSLIIVSGYLCLNAAIAGQKLIEPRVEIIQNARVALAIMSADLRAACPLDKTTDFIGMHRQLPDILADNLDFGTHNYTPRRPNEGDFCQESFYVDRDPETGQYSLWRRRNPTIGLDPLSGGRKEEIAKGVLGLKFEYFDGLDWYDTWGDPDGRGKQQTSNRERSNLNGLPDAVRITLWLDSNPRRKPADTQEAKPPEPPLAFQTVVRLNLARASSAGASGGSSDGSSPDADAGNSPQSDQPQQGGGSN